MNRRKPMRGLAAVLLGASLVLLGGSAAFGATPSYSVTTTTVATSGATFTINQTTLVDGESSTVSGTGYPANSTVVFTINDPVQIGSTMTDSSGKFTGSITVPADEALGTHLVNATSGTTVLGVNIDVVASTSSTSTTPATSTTPLARTGEDLGPLAGLGGAALVLGAAAVYGTRRRRQSV